ncbi:hypothetical protein ANN_14339 [Periplaneta americana]|uniref:Uncharacterized protein n=1 Tax=Periplaneta americana TaxID=6978 RepID=A0ABQ8SX44_PERAM|nr:hypothetical protein ANN_14339 [Periplaneta americana]
MDLREVGYDDRDWINLAQDRDRWRAYRVVTDVENINYSYREAQERKHGDPLLLKKFCRPVAVVDYLKCMRSGLYFDKSLRTRGKYERDRRQYAIRPILLDALANDFNCVNAVLRYLWNTGPDKCGACKKGPECEAEVTGGQEGRSDATRTGNMCPGVELTDERMCGLCLRVVSKMTPSQVRKRDDLVYVRELSENTGSRGGYS